MAAGGEPAASSAIISKSVCLRRGGRSGMREIVAFIFGLALLGNAALFVPQAIAVWRKKSDEAFRWSPSEAFVFCRLSGWFTASTSTTTPSSLASAPAFSPVEPSPCSRSSTVSAVCAPLTPIRRPNVPDRTTAYDFRHIAGCGRTGTTGVCKPGYTAVPQRRSPLGTAEAPRHFPGSGQRRSR